MHCKPEMPYAEELYVWTQMGKPELKQTLPAPQYKVCVMSNRADLRLEQVIVQRINNLLMGFQAILSGVHM